MFTDHRSLIYMVMTAVRTANKVVLRYLINLQEYSFLVTYMKSSLNLRADAVSRMIRYGVPHIHFPKTADKLRDDSGSMDLDEEEVDMGRKMIKDFLFLYPEISWRDADEQPIKTEK